MSPIQPAATRVGCFYSWPRRDHTLCCVWSACYGSFALWVVGCFECVLEYACGTLAIRLRDYFGILGGFLGESCGTLAGLLRDSCGTLAGLLRDSCRPLAGLFPGSCGTLAGLLRDSCGLSRIHFSEPTRLLRSSYSVFMLHTKP